MSSQKGNVRKTGAPKFQNRTAYKNNLHDTNKRTQKINDSIVSGVCARCKDIVEWKIKYKKYKPLTQPKKCVKCLQKTVRNAYYIVCQPCSEQQNICAKCAKPTDIVLPHTQTASEEAKQENALKFELQQMSERKRRSFFRLQESGKLREADKDEVSDGEEQSSTEDLQEASEDENIDSGDEEQSSLQTEAKCLPSAETFENDKQFERSSLEQV